LSPQSPQLHLLFQFEDLFRGEQLIETVYSCLTICRFVCFLIRYIYDFIGFGVYKNSRFPPAT
jgi:hypothetical protein